MPSDLDRSARWARPGQASATVGPTAEGRQVGALDGQLSLQHLHHVPLVGDRQDEKPIAGGTHERALR